jgi:hypothetical protein
MHVVLLLLFLVCSFQTIFDPTAISSVRSSGGGSSGGNNRRGGGGGNGGGGSGRRGGRIVGMDNLQADHSECAAVAAAAA